MDNANVNEWDSGREFVDLRWDAGFKAVLGDPANKGILIDFINTILAPERRIRDIVKYADRELEGLTPQNRAGRLDLRCIDDEGRELLIEMQNESAGAFFQRCVWYCSKIYSGELVPGEDYDRLTPVYLISVLGDTFPHEDKGRWGPDDIVSRYRMTEIRTGEVAPETFFINFVELGRFVKTRPEEIGSRLEWLCYIFTHPEEMSRVLETSEDGFVRDLVGACKVAGFTPPKRIEYEKNMLNEMDIRMKLKSATAKGHLQGHEEGFEEGVEKGREEGREEERLAIAKNFLDMGIPCEKVAEATGLDIAVVEGMKK